MCPMGRPLKQEGQARDKRIGIRLTDAEVKRLEELSEVLEKSRTDVIIMALDALYADVVEK